jgi:hypothetical protein
MRRINRREFVGTSLAVGAASTLPARSLFAANANEEISVGFIGCGGRASGLMGAFSKVDGVNIAGLCDPDEARVASAKKRFPRAKTWTDTRGMIDDKSIDAVVVAYFPLVAFDLSSHFRGVPGGGVKLLICNPLGCDIC